MEEIREPCCIVGARKEGGWAIPSPCTDRWRWCLGSIVYTICFIVLGGSICPLCSWILAFDVDDYNKLVYDFVEDRYNLEHLSMLDTENVISQLQSAHSSDPSIVKDGLEGRVLLLATWQRHVEVVRFRYIGGCVMSRHSFKDGATKRQHVGCLRMCVPLGNVLSQPPQRNVHGIPTRKFKRTTLGQTNRALLESYYYNVFKRPTLGEIEHVAKFLKTKQELCIGGLCVGTNEKGKLPKLS